MVSSPVLGSHHISALTTQYSFRPPTNTCTISSRPKPFSYSPLFPNPIRAISHSNEKIYRRRSLITTTSLSATAVAAEAAVEEGEGETTQKLGVVVKPKEKPTRLVLKFIWMEKNIGLALDQVIPGHGTIPLSPYYFWPRKDAWEELKSKLESKPWISQKRMIILLNQATDIINLWQQSGGSL